MPSSYVYSFAAAPLFLLLYCTTRRRHTSCSLVYCLANISETFERNAISSTQASRKIVVRVFVYLYRCRLDCHAVSLFMDFHIVLSIRLTRDRDVNFNARRSTFCRNDCRESLIHRKLKSDLLRCQLCCLCVRLHAVHNVVAAASFESSPQPKVGDFDRAQNSYPCPRSVTLQLTMV